MPKVFLMALTAVGVATLQFSVMAQTANAAIVCKDGFQNSDGNWISTPYCNDAHLAQLARNLGVKVSDEELRANPAKKDEVCRFIGNIGPGSEYCPDESGGRDGGH
ncbi:hypothetical protein [Hyphomicrobium sp. LHD-15]|uniref:hypothetical protein n=1 Tax=Hyphomicrobium sp. LHD-15 TaxID=3072142 RepID=UPI00280F6309|nr:hypothetical protein [Hyphomicrobium sp. LHD-15]MDQ8700120.1 hypothetical protein [Hyphomicrobium sp. LHD-15]